MYGDEDDSAARQRIVIMRRQAAASLPSNDRDESSLSLLRQQSPMQSYGGTYGSTGNSSLWTAHSGTAPFPQQSSGMNGGERFPTHLQEKMTPPSPRVTPPNYRNRAAIEGHYALIQGTQPLPYVVSQSPRHESVPLQASSGGAATTVRYDLDIDTDAAGGSKRGVPHVYHDYSQVPVHAEVVKKKSGGVTVPFPTKLYEMLENPDVDPEVVSWLPHGRAFVVKLPKRFTSEIMPKYFRQTKLTSFQRQLNLYGFRRLTRGADGGAYYHEMFLRGRPALCEHMRRQKVKGTGHKQPADANTEPNFYAMPLISPGAGSLGIAAYSPQRQITILPEAAIQSSPGLHGAAHLLRGFAGGSPSGLPQIPLLGPASAPTSLVDQDEGPSAFLHNETPRQMGASDDVNTAPPKT